jgi:hypothetical protein
MNDGVKLLLERMKTNPEEFTNGHKWIGLINSYKEYLNEEDAKVFNNAYNGLMQQTFTEQVMKELLAPEEDNSLGKPWYTKQTLMPLATTTLGVTLNNSGTVTSWEEREPLTQIVKKQKKHQTLFGKLFNYL